MNDNKELEEEFQNFFRKANMFLTMHTSLYDWYHRWSKFFDVLILIGSVVLCATTFVCHSHLTSLGLNPSNALLYLGIVSVVLFIISLFKQLVDLDGKAVQHRFSVQILSMLKVQLRDFTASDLLSDEVAVERMRKQYDLIVTQTATIPSSKFARLKSKHLATIKFNQYLDRNPSRAYLWNKILFCIEGFKTKTITRNDEREDPKAAEQLSND